MKYIKSIAGTLLSSCLIIGMCFHSVASAAIPGENTIINYNSSGTGIAAAGNMKAIMSSDGNTFVWGEYGTANVVSGIPQNSSVNVYVRNIKTGATSIANIKQNGDPFGVNDDREFAISSTGRFVAIASSDTDIVSSPVVPSTPDRWQLYLRDTRLNTTSLVTQNALGVAATYSTSGRVYVQSVSDDGRFVSFSINANNMSSSGTLSTPGLHYFVKDMQTGQVVNIMASNSGQTSNATVNGAASNCDGSMYLITTAATNLSSDISGNSNVYLVDIRNGYKIENISATISQPVSGSALSCNGRYVVLSTTATGLTSDAVSGANNRLFRYDRLTGEYALVDKSTSGYIPTTTLSNTQKMGVSDNGRVVFLGRDPQLVTPTAANSLQIYLRDPEAGTTQLVPVDSAGVEYGIGTTTLSTRNTQISADGNYALYNTTSQTMIPGIGNSAGVKIVRSKLN